ncbi:RES family NAD+ phosphorylase [Hydrocarboniphaga sp.]|uniref:RES family NAD+ phosphorylase n=1 Tax=Hydrocarboniphaga sp. TaxID=2033016 RepID=UPI0026070E35|nr:RES family NAD+ phosphorylase [Hydrocarboniphaga sp.]
MRLWRISAWPGLDGTGGLHTSGRWHTVGRLVIYAGEHPALAMIETMAHMRLTLTSIPLTLKLIPIDVADGAVISPSPTLPPGWQANEPTSQAVGDAWLASGAGLLLPVPSALLAHSTNYIINPAHPQAPMHLMEGNIEPFWFDKRYLR